MSLDFQRQAGIWNPEDQSSKIIVVGAGSTGSFITLTLAKMGFSNITSIDFDEVEAHNIPNQFYREQDIGKPKVEALKEIIKDFTDIEITALNSKIDGDPEFDLDLDTIIILCVDSIEARKLIYDKIKDMPIRLIDTRMGGLGYQIYTTDLTNDETKTNYEKTLNAEIKEAPCGQKSIIFTILSIASETCNIVRKLDCNETYLKIIKREMDTYKILGG